MPFEDLAGKSGQFLLITRHRAIGCAQGVEPLVVDVVESRSFLFSKSLGFANRESFIRGGADKIVDETIDKA